MYDVIVDGTSSREQPLILITTTAGTVRENVYDRLYEEAELTINSYDSREYYELHLEDDKQIYFKSILTGIEYRIGDRVKLKSNISCDDGKRNFKICSWYINGSPKIKNQFGFIYFYTEDGKSLHLDYITVYENI